MRARTVLPLAALAAASLSCVALLVVRKAEYGSAEYKGLVWNLALAWVPFLLALLLVVAYRKRMSSLHLGAIAAAWLLFLPNAPYVLTDFVHLEARHRLFDTVVIGSFALTSLALGFGSLLLVQLVATRAGGAAIGWLVALGSLFLASVGIYLGRVQRLNSWDIVQRPRAVGSLLRSGLEDPLAHQHPIGLVLAIAGLLTLVYLGLYGFAALAATARRD
jgi:uncharacterized membrane protein